MAGRQPTLVNRQFNSPIKLYSPQNVAETLNKQAHILANGAVGIDFHQLAAPTNLANSAVLRMLEEEERQRGEKGGRRVRCGRFIWPPKKTNNFYPSTADDDSCKVKGRQYFLPTTSDTSPGFKRVEWPPPPEENDLAVIESEPVYSKGSVFGSSPSLQPAARQQQPLQQQQPPQQQQPAYQTHVAPVSRAYQPAPPPPPATITLRPSPPVHEEPHPVFESQPAATRAIGPRMRGDEKWPPTEYKARAEEENAARRALAKGPAFRPRKVNKDYSTFFAKNALTTTYPGYKAPPGTQHYTEEGTSNL